MLLYKSIVLTVNEKNQAGVKINNCTIQEALILLNAGLSATIQKMIELNSELITPKGAENDNQKG